MTTTHEILNETAHTLWNTGGSHRGFIQISRSGRVQIRGEQHQEAEVVQFTDSVLTIKIAGGKYWSGRGSQGYSGAEVRTYLVHEVAVVTGDNDNFDNITVSGVRINWHYVTAQYTKAERASQAIDRAIANQEASK